jgi:hypothetical protein
MPSPDITAREQVTEILEDLDLIRDDDDVSSNESGNTPFAEIAEQRLSRRGMLAGVAVLGLVSSPGVSRRALAAGASLTFREIPQIYDKTHHVAPGYTADVMLRWGDLVVAGAPPFDPMNHTAAAQVKQFGYNCDYIGFLPLPAGSTNGDRGLLCVNHEYTNRHLMFPGVGRNQRLSKFQTEIEMAAHGHSVVEIVKQDGKWSVAQNSSFNRRIHVGTPMRLSGPAAGHRRLQTNADPTGTTVIGTINNCAGGKSSGSGTVRKRTMILTTAPSTAAKTIVVSSSSGKNVRLLSFGTSNHQSSPNPRTAHHRTAAISPVTTMVVADPPVRRIKRAVLAERNAPVRILIA